MKKPKQNTENGAIFSRNMLEGFHYKTSSQFYEHEHQKTNPKKYINDLLSTGSDTVMTDKGENQPMIVPEVTIQTTHTNSPKTPLVRDTCRRSSCPEKLTKPVNQPGTGLLVVERGRSRTQPSSDCSSGSVTCVFFFRLLLHTVTSLSSNLCLVFMSVFKTNSLDFSSMHKLSTRSYREVSPGIRKFFCGLHCLPSLQI